MKFENWFGVIVGAFMVIFIAGMIYLARLGFRRSPLCPLSYIGIYCGKRAPGIEPESSAWQANVVPLDHTRKRNKIRI